MSPRAKDEPMPKLRPITAFADLDRFAQEVANDLYQPVMVISRRELKRACVCCGGTNLTVTYRLVVQRTATVILCDKCTGYLATKKLIRKLYRKLRAAEKKGAIVGRIKHPSFKKLKVWIDNESSEVAMYQKGGTPLNG